MRLWLVLDLFPSISLCDSSEVQELAVNLLYPFYEKRESYGPSVLIALVNCLGQISKVCSFYSLLLSNEVQELTDSREDKLLNKNSTYMFSKIIK